MVGARLRNHYDTHHGHTVHLHVALEVGGAEFGYADVPDAHDVAVLLLYYYVVELLRGVHLPHGAERKLHAVALDTSRRKLHILACNGILDVYGCDTICSHLHWVEPYTHGVAFLAPYLHAAHVGDCLQLLLDGEVGNLAQLEQRAAVALYRHHKNGHGVGIGL